jgi:hypothetical protein
MAALAADVKTQLSLIDMDEEHRKGFERLVDNLLHRMS